MPILIDATGVAREVPDDLVPTALERGWSPEDTAGRLSRVAGEVREEEYGGTGGAVVGGLAALGRGATLGLTDAAVRLIGGDDAAIALEGYRDVNPGISIAGEVVGGVAPALVSGGSSLPAGAASLAGRAAGRAAGGGLRGALTAGAVEGGLQGVGAGVSELALSTDPLTLERAASVLSSNALFGAGVGGAAGGVAHGASRVLAKGKTVIDDALARRAAKASTPGEAIDKGDLSLLDKRTLDLAEKDELARVRQEQAPARKALVDELDTYRNANRDDHAMRAVTSASGEKDIEEAGASFVRNDKRLRGFLDDRVGFAENPERARTHLRAQQQSLEEIVGWAREQEGAWKRAVAEAPTRIRQEIKGGLVDGEKGPFTEQGLDLAVEREIKARSSLHFGGAFATGLKQPPAARMIHEYERVLDWNRRFQAQLDELAKPPTSDRLTKIAEARAVLEQPKEPSVGGALLSAVSPFAGPLGVAATTGARVVGVFRKAASAVAERTGQAVSAFSGAAAAAAPYTPVVATKVLQGVRYGARDDDEPDDLPKLFKRRSDEVKQLTEYDETGTPRVRPEVRAQIFERLKPIAAVDPIAADRLETAAVRRIEHVSGLIPRQPDFGGLAMPNWQPSDMEMRAWARAVAAAEDPAGVEERAAYGALSPEDVAAYWAVYPERAEDFKQSILAEIETGKLMLPYDRKLTMSMLLGQPLDPSLHPAVISVLQGQFPLEPGSAGGAQAPRAQPQFGSMSKLSDSAKTPAQERQS